MCRGVEPCKPALAQPRAFRRAAAGAARARRRTRRVTRRRSAGDWRGTRRAVQRRRRARAWQVSGTVQVRQGLGRHRVPFGKEFSKRWGSSAVAFTIAQSTSSYQATGARAAAPASSWRAVVPTGSVSHAWLQVAVFVADSIRRFDPASCGQTKCPSVHGLPTTRGAR